MFELIDGYLKFLRAAGLPETTVKLRWYQLMRLARCFDDVSGVSRDDLVGWLTSHGWALETMRAHRSAVRGFFEWLFVGGVIACNPAAGLPTVKRARHLPRPARDDEVWGALDSCDARVGLMIELAAFHGLRRSEIACVSSRDLVRDSVGWSLIVHGKGDKERLIPVSDSVAFKIRGADGWVFPGNIGGHLSPAYVGKIVSEALPVGVSCHMLRHRFATAAYQGTRDLYAVQALLGHSKPETTANYVLIPTDNLRAAMLAAA